MRFYRIEGVNSKYKNYEDMEDCLVVRSFDRKRKLKIKESCRRFNQKHKNNALMIVSTEENSYLSIIAVSFFDCELLELVSELTDAFDVSMDIESKDEISFEEFRNLLDIAEHNDYIDDDRLVLNELGLSGLRQFYHVDYIEKLAEPVKKCDANKRCDLLLSSHYFKPEMDRIFGGNDNVKFMGHPVHYIIESDDEKFSSDAIDLLASALYSNKRVLNKRYSIIDLNLKQTMAQAIEKPWLNAFYVSSKGGIVALNCTSNKEDEDNHAVINREMIENICNIVKKYRNEVLTIFLFPRENKRVKDLYLEELATMSFVNIQEDLTNSEEAIAYLKLMAKNSGVRANKELLNKIESDMTYLPFELKKIYAEWYSRTLKNKIYSQYKDIEGVYNEVKGKKPKGSAFKELDEMIGLESAKEVIKSAIDYNKAKKIFHEKGMTDEKPSMHMVFSGNPGTAKTSVARLLAKIMRENGLLENGRFVEVGRGDLVGKYVGWTAPTIQRKFKEAAGGVLFIDEAYSLVDDVSGSYGDEAINTIVQEMENNRESVLVIFAGYFEKMEGFLEKNPGLRSRIAYHVRFEDYNAEELCDIAKLIASKKNLSFTDEALEKMYKIFDKARMKKDFGNGRFARNLVERSKMKLATRLLKKDLDSVTKKDIQTICVEDVEEINVGAKIDDKKIGFI